MVSVVLEEVPAPALDAKLEGWAGRIAFMAGAFGGIVADFHEMEGRRFRAEGPGWAPLAPSTVTERTRAGYGGAHPILRRTDLLANSLNRTGAEGAVVRVEPDELFVGTNDPKARFHQEGSSRLPQRLVVQVDEPDRARWMGLLADWIAGRPVKWSTGAGPSGL